ncbi:spore germination protein [Bacillus sp. EAC]|uniref:spore germination protein n=1 Tax=Bacillus sp. EAC TaxID=1978338 RepID=UPI000B43EE58|nr:spore germination protein [Bacillus sp. EAC]
MKIKPSDELNATISLNKNIEVIKETLNNTADLSIRPLQIGGAQKYEGVLLYIENLVDSQAIRDNIISPLLQIRNSNELDHQNVMKSLAYHHIQSPSVEISQSIKTAVNGIVRGKTLLMVAGFDQIVIAETTQWQQRSVEQSSRQRSPAGPMIGLSEQLKVNINLIRNFILSPNLVVEMKQIGRFAQTDLSIVYLKDKVDTIALEEVRSRIDLLDVEYVLESRVIEDVLEGRKKSIFPLVFNTEMPDIAAAALYEGRIAVLVNGTPQAIIVPSLFVQYMAEPNEYYTKNGRLSNRFILFFCYFLSILLPGIYVAVANFHEDWLPIKFAKKYFTHSETILPFFGEVSLLLLILYIMSLISFRIQTDLIIVASLVGTMVISTTAVDANLIHSLSLIIVGISFLTNMLFATGGMNNAAFSLRFLFLIFGSFFGLTAIGIGVIFLIIYLSLLRSVGVPYLAPIIPFRPQEFKDVFYRGDLKKLINSPHKYPHDDKE